MTEPSVVGFGCPNTVDPHHFEVLIPSARAADVAIIEQFGLSGGTNGVPESVERCRLPRGTWTAIAETAKKAMNERLKEKELPAGRWLVGANKVERLLGKELCLLAWAVERVEVELVPNALRNWQALRPEERWWLFAMVAAGAGTADHGDIGWRKAVRVALTEAVDDAPATPRARRRGGKDPADERQQIAMFLRERADG
jgi:hypothetical protein